MNLFSNGRRTVNVKLIIIGALMAPISFVSNSAFSSEKISENKNHLCFADNSNTIQVCEIVPFGFNTSSITNSYSSHNALDLEKPISSINNYIQQPENPTDIGSYIISILALLVSGGIPLWQRHVQIRDSKNQKLDSINEGFWIREVVMPQINLNIFNLCTAFRNKINLSQPEFTIVYRDELLPLLNELRDSFSLFKAFPNASNAIITLQQHCDDFDDNINDHINEPLNIRKTDISTFQLTLTKELIKTHMLLS